MRDLTIGVIGGTGLGQAFVNELAEPAVDAVVHEIDTPFGSPSAPIVQTQLAGVRVLFLARHGKGHVIPPSSIPFRANLFALKKLGCTHVIGSGAVGSLRDEFAPRDLVVVDQVIDKTHRRVGTFFDRAAVHVEFADPFCPVLRQMLLETAKLASPANAMGEIDQLKVGESRVHDFGTYVTMEGPAFSTRAEALMHRMWGGDLIGMTAMPEAKLAREAELPYALVALVTDYDCWKPKPVPKEDEPAPTVSSLLAEIRHNIHVATRSAIDLIRATISRIGDSSALQQTLMTTCPAHQALAHAIWSDTNQLDPVEVERLAVLWKGRIQLKASHG
jgi:5'-methylthioadenosine phosphorylase